MKLLVILLLLCIFTVSGCQSEQEFVAKSKQLEIVVEDTTPDDTVVVEYDGGGIDVNKGIQEVLNMNSDYTYTDETFINTDDLPDKLRTPLEGEIPAVQTALLSLVKSYCSDLGINYELLEWESPISEQCDNHNVYLLQSVASTLRIHVAATDSVVACIE